MFSVMSVSLFTGGSHVTTRNPPHRPVKICVLATPAHMGTSRPQTCSNFFNWAQTSIGKWVVDLRLKGLLFHSFMESVGFAPPG